MITVIFHAFVDTCVFIMLDILHVKPSTRRFCSHDNKIRFLGYKWNRYAASDLHEITFCREEKVGMSKIDLMFYTEVCLSLCGRGGDEIGMISNECFPRLYGAVSYMNESRQWIRRFISFFRAPTQRCFGQF